MNAIYRCVRCGHVGPGADFLVLRGFVSQSCNACLEPIFSKDRFSPRHSAAAVRGRKRAGARMKKAA